MMQGFIGLTVIILALTAAFSAAIAGVNIQEIKENWDKRRCDVWVMTTAPLYKGDGDPRGSVEFASDNFTFCVNSLAQSVLAAAFKPLQEIMKQQVQAAGALNGIANNLRGQAKNVVGSFSDIVQERFRKFANMYDHLRHGYASMDQAMGKISGVVISLLFSGLSGVTFMQNMTNFAMKVVIIMISILAALVVFLFFIMFPVIPLIVTTIGVVTAAGFGGAVSQYSDAFCLHPETEIHMGDGLTKQVQDIVLGDVLPPSFKTYRNANVVSGILKADGSNVQLWDIDGVLMSGTHRVFHRGEWILARSVPGAQLTTKKANTLYILNTEHHWVPVKGSTQTVYVSDWEEVDTLHGQMTWLQYVWKTLNPDKVLEQQTQTQKKPSLKIPSTVPLVDGAMAVQQPGGQRIRAKDIHIGDVVLDASGNKTTVVGTYIGSLRKPEKIGLDWISDGNWVCESGVWRQYLEGLQTPELFVENEELLGYSIITESGSYRVWRNGETVLLRDFTECGMKHLEGCYPYLDFVL